MNCGQIKNLITIHVFGSLTAEEKIQLEKHLRGCPHCSRIYEKTAKLSSLFEEKEDIPLPEKEKSWQVISAEALQKRAGWKFFSLHNKLVLTVSALLVVFILGFVLGKLFFLQTPDTLIPESAILQAHESPIQSYVESLELILVSFMNRTDAKKQEEISAIEKSVIKDMLVQTRLLKSLTSQRGDPYIQRLLEDLEFILVGISNLKPQDQDSAAQLTRLIQESELRFKIRTVLSSKTTI